MHETSQFLALLLFVYNGTFDAISSHLMASFLCFIVDMHQILDSQVATDLSAVPPTGMMGMGMMKAPWAAMA